MRFNGFGSTNTMSGEISGFQKILSICPHSKYINCRNHWLALVFDHLILKYICLKEVDAFIMAAWKLTKYSRVKAVVFGTANSVEGQKNLKLLKATPARWLSHGEASKHLVSCMESLINSLDTIINNISEPEIKGIQVQLQWTPSI